LAFIGKIRALVFVLTVKMISIFVGPRCHFINCRGHRERSERDMGNLRPEREYDNVKRIYWYK
jgi:hypothetical protein